MKNLQELCLFHQSNFIKISRFHTQKLKLYFIELHYVLHSLHDLNAEPLTEENLEKAIISLLSRSKLF